MNDVPDPEDDRTVIRPAAPRPTAPAATESPSQAARSQPAGSAGDSGNAAPIGTYLAEFEIQQVLGEGGFGIVYQAWDHSLERKVALKEYMPSSLAARASATTVQVKSERHRETFEAGRKSFINEAKLLAQFDHPSLVKVYRFWEANGTAYMVMPLYEGTTLKDHLKQRGGPPDEAWLMSLLDPLTEALAAIHAESCFHRDIAPDNVILLAGSGRPLLLDFGAARRVIGDMTQALTVILKPGYAPIEQYAEAPHMKQGAWTDIYALAASVHFALVGRTPPPSVSRMMSDTYQPLATQLAGRYSARFLEAIDRALIVKPEERTQSIAELRTALGLDEFAGAKTTVVTRSAAAAAAVPTRTTESTAPPKKRSSTALIAVGIAALALAGGGAYVLTQKSEPATANTAAAPAPSATPEPSTATTTAAAPTPPPAPRRFDALEQFDAVIAAQTPGRSVTAKAVKDALRIGKDNLAFTVTADHSGYLSVLLLGPDGSLIQLFPNKQATSNRIAAGQPLKLPGASWPLEAAEPAGVEHFLVIVSDRPRDYSGLSTEYDDMFLKLPTGDLANALLASEQRTTPMLLGAAPAGCAGDDCAAYAATRFTIEVIN